MRTALRVVAIIYAAYLAIALLLITPALNLVPHWYAEKTWDRQLQTKWVLLNPFKLSLDIREAALFQPDGERFLELGDASVNLSLESLVQPGWVLDELSIHQLFAHLVRRSETEFNFSDMIPATEEETTPDEASEPPGVTVKTLEFHAKKLMIEDLSRENPYDNQLNNISFRVTGLSTVMEDQRPYALTLEGPYGGQLQWGGTVSIPNRHSAGQLSLTDLNLHALWRIAEPWLAFEISDGQLSVSGDYEVSWGDAVSYRVSGVQLGLDAIQVQPRTPGQLPDTSLQLASLEVTGVEVDSSTLQATVDSLAIDGLAASGWSEGQRISLAELFTGPASAEAQPEAETQPEPGPQPEPESHPEPEPQPESKPQPESEPQPGSASEQQTGEGWSATVGKVALTDSSLNWRSAFTDPPLLQVTPIEASIENLNWPLAGDSPFTFNLTVNSEATFELVGSLALAEGRGDISYALGGLPLAWFNPNLPEALQATITGGQVLVDGDVSLDAFAPARLALNAEIKGFASRWNESDELLTGWETVRLQGLAVDMVERELVLERVVIDRYTGRLHIYEDGSINASQILKEEIGDEAEDIAEDLSEGKPWSFDIPVIVFTESEIDFMDQSLPIPFRTVVGDLNGDIMGISSEPGATAQVDIKGSVDGYAPVELAGTANPFATPLALDLGLTFAGVDMALLSPYSGTYAGYKIERGLLDLDLKYKLNNGKLEGENKVRMDQLKLGEKIDSEQAIDAPLELALSIMTDANGVIDMSVPVSGDMNDPEFELGSVITKAFLNVITKIVTAPFSVLASLVGSEEDLQRVTFPAGSAELDAAGTAKIMSLATALQQRPKISLVITGRVNADADRERLQKDMVKAQMLEDGLTQEEVDSKAPRWEQAILERFEPLPAGTTDPATLTIRDKYLAVAHSIPLSDDQLVELAAQRAVAVKTMLVNEGQLAAERAVVAQTELGDEANRFSGADLSAQ